MKTERERIVDEILDTEMSYLNTLTDCRAFYWDDMRYRKPSSMLIPIGVVNEVFYGFDNTITVAQYITTELKKLRDEGKLYTSVQDVFMNAAPVTLFIRDCVGNNSRAIKIVNGFKENKRIENYLEQIRLILPTKPQLDLASMLITPVQRSPRYVLLLEQVLKHTKKEDDPQLYTNIEKSLNLMKDVAKRINAYIADFERIIKLKEIGQYIDKKYLDNLLCQGRHIKAFNCEVSHGQVYSVTTDYLVVGMKTQTAMTPVKTIPLLKAKFTIAPDHTCTISDCGQVDSVTLSFPDQTTANTFAELMTNTIESCDEVTFNTLQSDSCRFCYKPNVTTKCPICNEPICKECKVDTCCYHCLFQRIAKDMKERYIYAPKQPIVIKTENQLIQSIKEKESLTDSYADWDLNKPSAPNQQKKHDPFAAFLQGEQKADTDFFMKYTKDAEEKKSQAKIVSTSGTEEQKPLHTDAQKESQPVQAQGCQEQQFDHPQYPQQPQTPNGQCYTQQGQYIYGQTYPSQGAYTQSYPIQPTIPNTQQPPYYVQPPYGQGCTYNYSGPMNGYGQMGYPGYDYGAYGY